jgi:hypothetical protein
LKSKRRSKHTAAANTAGDGGAAGSHLAAISAQAEIAVVDIDDPVATKTGEKVTVLRQLRSDPLARLHAHRQIDEAQYRAGRVFQRDCEIAERGVRALDPTRERVDGGAMAQAVGDAQMRARKRLIAMEHVLGRTMHRVTHAVLVDGMSMETLAKALFDREGEVAVKYYGRLFRDALDVLAVEYGLAGKVGG